MYKRQGLARTAVVRELHDVLGEAGFTDWRPADPAAVEVPGGVPRLAVEPAALRRADRCEPVDLTEALGLVEDLSDDELSYLVLGDYRDGAESQSIIGAAAQSLVGAAGQTTTRFEGVPSLVMPDGPAGLRIAPRVGIDDDGAFALDSALPADFAELMDDEAEKMLGAMMGTPDRPRTPERTIEQYATACLLYTSPSPRD